MLAMSARRGRLQAARAQPGYSQQYGCGHAETHTLYL